MIFFYLLICSIMVLLCFYLIISPFFAPKEEIDFGEADIFDEVYDKENDREIEPLIRKMSEEDLQDVNQQSCMPRGKIIEREQAEKEKEMEQEILKELQKIRGKKES